MDIREIPGMSKIWFVIFIIIVIIINIPLGPRTKMPVYGGLQNGEGGVWKAKQRAFRGA